MQLDEDFLYEETSHIADKLRSVWVLFGWIHMLKEFDQAQNLIDELLNSVYDGLINGELHYSCSSAGLMIEGSIDEEGIVDINYYFNLK